VVAIRSLAAEDAAHRVLVVDLDVHHGNGNAER
jgi:acetoin utilization deacetylase AcuC-like enzyme